MRALPIDATKRGCMKRVMIFGTFDVLHLGHMSLIEQAKEKGDELLVVIARDARVEEIKGVPPIFSEEERMCMLSHIKGVDEVVLGDLDDVYEPIRVYKPDVIVLGYDQTHFVDGIIGACATSSHTPQVIRAMPHKEHCYKSGIIKKAIHATL